MSLCCSVCRINWSMRDMDNRAQLLNTKNNYSTSDVMSENTIFTDAVTKGVGLEQFNATKASSDVCMYGFTVWHGKIHVYIYILILAPAPSLNILLFKQ